jgi:carotenoid cleavage dioxygenase-like enzyme
MSLSSSQIVKLNVTTSESMSWSEDGKVCVCEPVFVPNPDSKDEDDGVLLVTLQNLENPERCTLLMLDSEIMMELARIEFHTKEPISHSSHGPWIPAATTSTKESSN